MSKQFVCVAQPTHVLRFIFGGVVLAGLFGLTGCGGAEAPKKVVLNGAGATFPYPAYSKWISEYKEERPTTEIAYRLVGSGAGIEELAAGKADFAGTDMPLTNEQLGKFKDKPLHFPMLIGAVVPVYNVQGAGELNFSGDVLAGILTGRINSWSHPEIKKDNPSANLPATSIKVIHRADASGTTFLLTDYLSSVNPQWKAGIGEGTTVRWPVGQEVSGSEAMADAVSKTPGGFGYVELNYAVSAKLAHGAVQNQAGVFKKADFESVGAAVDVAQVTSEFRTVAVNSSAKDAYPIAGLTYLLVPRHWQDTHKREAMKKFLMWTLSKGQKSVLSLDYNLLPPPIREKAENQVDQIQ